jgi:hypothetical protein
MKLLAIPKVLGKPYVLLSIALVLAVLVATYFFVKNTKTEGFQIVTKERKDLEESAKRRYNNWSETQDPMKEGVVPTGQQGDSILAGLLRTPSYAANSLAKNLSGLNYNDPLPYSAPPDNPELMARIRMCEKVTSWDCEKLSDPAFMQYCGVCSVNGEDHKGKPHVGGLYLDPHMKTQIEQTARSNNTVPKYTPTAGKCGGEFLLTRPLCDVQKDRYEVSQAQNFNNLAASTKGALCVNSPNNRYVYIGKRGEKDTGYALQGKPVKFTARLRFAVTHPGELASITVLRDSDGTSYQGGFISQTNVYICDMPNTQENDTFTLTVNYNTAAAHAWTSDEVARITALVNPPQAQLVQAAYGPVTGDVTKDDPRAVDVTQSLKSRYQMTDCSKTVVRVSNDAFGSGDPTPGIGKQARLVYSNDGQNFAYAIGFEGGNTAAVQTDNYNALCPPKATPADAEKAVCEISADQTPSGNVYTRGNNNNYPGAGGAWCVSPLPGKRRGIVGQWESIGSAPRIVPLDISVLQINGQNVPQQGPMKLGTLKGSKYFSSFVTPAKAVGIAGYLFWFWAQNPSAANVSFKIVCPATFVDTTVVADTPLCPMGPLVSTAEAAARLQAGACEKPVNGQSQAPGTYTSDCIKSLFLSSGCIRQGAGFPNTTDKMNAIAKDPITKVALDVDTINDNLNELYVTATTGKNSDGLQVSSKSLSDASLQCFNKIITSPCDTPMKNTGPQSIDCLDYLFRNAGKDNSSIGQTYPGQYDRSSGTGRTTDTPIMFCQRAGTMSPIGADGKPNMDAIATANNYGSVARIRDFYRQIHYDANYSSESGKQKGALNQCYGVGVKATAPPCKGVKARYVRIRPTIEFADAFIQISQIQVFTVDDKEVAKGMPTTATSTYGNGQFGTTADKAVDGTANTRAWPSIYCSDSVNVNTTYWQVDLKSTQEISYVIYYNRQDGSQFRAKGMRVQLVDDNNVVVKEKKLSGAISETVLFSNAKPSNLLKAGTVIQFVPSRTPSSVLAITAGNEMTVQPKVNTSTFLQSAAFVATTGNAGVPGSFSFKHKFSDNYLRVQGFRVRAAPDDGSSAFKSETTFKVKDSITGNPGEVSYESVANPGSYLAVAENGGAYISAATSVAEQKVCAWRIVKSPV